MANTLQNLSANLKEMMDNRELFFKSVKKTDIEDYILQSISASRGLAGQLQQLVDEPFRSKILETLTARSKDSTAFGVIGYKQYRSKLRGKPDVSEKKIPLSSLLTTVQMQVSALEELHGNLDKIFASRQINMFNTRLSHIAIIGLLIESSVTYRYGLYLLSALIADVTKDEYIPARYRREFFKNKSQLVANAINRNAYQRGGYAMSAIIADMKSKAIDVNLFDAENNILVDEVPIGKMSKQATIMLDLGGAATNFFRWIGEVWVTKRKERIDRIRREKAWMTARVALLKMELDGIDKKSGEYQRQLDIIAKYEEMINSTDAKIQAYEKDF